MFCCKANIEAESLQNRMNDLPSRPWQNGAERAVGLQARTTGSHSAAVGTVCRAACFFSLNII